MLTHHRRFKATARPLAIAMHMARRGHEVTLIVTADKRRLGRVESDQEGVRIVETPDLLWGQLRSGWDPWSIVNRLMLLNSEIGTYDVVHCFETRPATIYPALFYSYRHGLPLVTDWNDWWGRGGLISERRPGWYRRLFGFIETFYEEAFRKRGEGLTVISRALKRRAIHLGVAEDKILYLPGGARPDIFRSWSKTECRRRAGYPEAVPILAYSSLDTYLDLELVLDALSIVARRYPNIQLIITGDASYSVLSLAQRYGVENNVTLTGLLPIEELPFTLSCADVFVLPISNKIHNIGRWPNKIGEYMSLGRPTVTNPVGEMRSLFSRNEIGLLAEWSATDFARQIMILLENPTVAERLGSNARELAVSQYDWRHLIVELERFYSIILDRKRAGMLSKIFPA